MYRKTLLDFDEQMDAAEELYGNQLEFLFDVEELLRGLRQFEGIYGKRVCRRVEAVIRRRARKYRIFF